MKFLIFFIWISCGFTNDNVWLINKDHSEINFSISYMKVAKVSGRFVRFRGRGVFESNKISSVKLVIEADSIFTGNSLRDSHLKQVDFLNVAQFPQITFESDKISTTMGNDYVAVGELTIRKKKKKISFTFKQSSKEKDTWGKDSIFISFSGVIDRADYDLNWNKSLEGGEFIVGNQIAIVGNFQMQLKGEQTPSSRYKISDNKFLREREKLARGEVALDDIEKIDKIEHSIKTSTADQQLVQKTAPVEIISNEKQKVDDKLYLFSLITLSFIGFLGAILVSLEIKRWLLKQGKEKYSELNLWGLLGDICAILVMILYAISVYYVALK